MMHDHGIGGQPHQQGQPQMQQPAAQQWVVVQGHPVAGLGPQHQPTSVAVVCDAMAELHAMAGSGTTMMPLTALYPQYVQLQPAAAANMGGRPGPPPGAGMQYAAPPGSYMQAPHMQQAMPPHHGAQRYGQALWSDVPGMQQQPGRGRGHMGQHPMMMHAAGPPAVTKGSTVEEILQVVRHMPRGASVVHAVRDSLQYLDSRALAALLKELSKTGLRDMAFHIFNWLREPQQSMDPAYGGLLDVFTYTTMIVSAGQSRAEQGQGQCQIVHMMLLRHTQSQWRPLDCDSNLLFESYHSRGVGQQVSSRNKGYTPTQW